MSGVAIVDDGQSAPRKATQWLALSWRTSLLMLGAFSVVIGIIVMDHSPIGAYVDDAMYLILAKSLAAGQGYRSLNLPGQPLNTHFPPGYPAALAVLWRVAPAFPDNLALFRLFNVACVAAASVGTARFAASRGVGRRWALGVGVLTAISVPSLVLGNLLLSEPFFLALLLFTLTALERFAALPVHGASSSGLRPALLGVVIGLCMLVRTHGIVLVPAMFVALGARRRWRAAAVLSACALLCLLPWQLFTARHGHSLPAPLLGEYDSYTAWWIRGLHEFGWSMLPITLSRTIPEAAQMFAALFSPVRTAGAPVTLVALAVLVAAGIAAWWKRIPVTILFLGGYLTIVAVWPSQPSRFIWGVWPLILVLLVLGAHAAVIDGARWHRAIRVLVLASCCWVAVGYGRYEVRAVRGRWWSSIPRAAVDHVTFAIGWTRANTAPDDIVSTEDEGAVFLYTGRRTIPVRTFTVDQYLGSPTPEQEARAGLVPLLAAYPARAVLVSNRLARDAARYLAGLPAPRLAARGEYAGGAAYIVLPP
ncbi:hypothetical protein BH11GEM1_BH11GEM1_28390 [soil metagenome]